MIYKAFVETAVQRGKETYEKEFQKISSDAVKILSEIIIWI